MESLFKSDMLPRTWKSIVAVIEKCDEKLSGEKQKSNKNRIQRRWKDYHLQLGTNETPHFSNAETVL